MILIKDVVKGSKLMAPQYMSQRLCKLIHELMINTNLDSYNPKKGLNFD
jgi:hypothetical protein